MQLVVVGIGLSMVALSGILSGVGHYDGVLGTTDPTAAFDSVTPTPVTLRVIVKGSVQEAEAKFAQFGTELRLPLALQDRFAEDLYVPVEVPRMKGHPETFLKVQDGVPSPGEVFVVEGTMRAYWPMYRSTESDLRAFEAVQIVLLEPSQIHAPLLFKA